MPNAEMGDRIVRDPRSGRPHYIHPPSEMPMMTDARRVDPDMGWTPFAVGERHFNNHYRRDGMKVLFLDGHGIWVDRPWDANAPERRYQAQWVSNGDRYYW